MNVLETDRDYNKSQYHLFLFLFMQKQGSSSPRACIVFLNRAIVTFCKVSHPRLKQLGNSTISISEFGKSTIQRDDEGPYF